MAAFSDRLSAFARGWRGALRREPLTLSVLAVVIGTASAYGAIAFHTMITLFQRSVFGASDESLASFAASLPWWHVVLAPTLGGLAIGVFIHVALPGGRYQGVAEVIEAGALRGGRIEIRAGLGAAFAAISSIGVGASVGREGPVVHLGASMAAWLSRRFRFGRGSALTLLGCGVASAVAASFNAPIAGVFFALEVVIGNYALAAFAPVVVASVAGTIIARIHFGDFPAFIVPPLAITSFLELPAFVLLGLVAAAVAGLFMAAAMLVENGFSRTPLPRWARPAVAGLAVGLIAVFFPHVLGVGYEATNLALKEALPLALLVALICAKLVATALSIGGGFGGGVFSPSLFLGAMTGGAFGMIAGQVAPELASAPGAYTIIGMAAVASAVLGAPVSTILIVFELTGDYGVTIAVMIASTVASVTVAQMVPGRSFFHWQLARRGIDLARERPRLALRAMTVTEVMNPVACCIPRRMKLADLRDLLRRDPQATFCVTDDDGCLIGMLAFPDLGELLFRTRPSRVVDLGEIAHADDALLLADDSLAFALDRMRDTGLDRLPVIDDPKTRRVIGVVHHKDIILAHNAALAADFNSAHV